MAISLLQAWSDLADFADEARLLRPALDGPRYDGCVPAFPLRHNPSLGIELSRSGLFAAACVPQVPTTGAMCSIASFAK